MARKYFRSNSTARSGLKAVCAALLLAFTAGPLFAQGLPFGTGPFLHVECDPPGADLQKTLDTAVSGSEIFIVGTCDDGPYRIHAKDLALVASSGGTGVILSGSGAEESVLGISGGSYVLLQGRPLQDFVVDAQGNDEGITVDNGSSVVIDTVTVEGAAGSGIFFARGSSGIIVGESVFRNNGVGIQFRTNSAGLVAEGTVVDGNDQGMVVDSNSSVSISETMIINNFSSGISGNFGSLMRLGDSNTIENNNENDVVCTNNSMVDAQTTQSSSTKDVSEDVTCLIVGDIFEP